MSWLSTLAGSPGDRPDAVTVGGAPASWAELRTRAEKVADRIVGARAVAIAATPELSTVVTLLAGLLAKVPLVPIAPDVGDRERSHILTDSGAEVLLTGESTVDIPDRPAVTLPADTALVLYTSGTTGPPKGVALTEAAIAADVDALARAWDWTADDTLAHGLPLYHVHGLVLGLLGPLRLGCRLVHTGRPSPAAYAAAGATVYFGVPTIWSRIAQDPDSARALAGARLLVSGSAALSPAVFAAIAELTGQRPVERYGMTETLITVATRAAGPRRPGRVGAAVDGVATRVAGEDAELQVRGATLFTGYLNQPDTTAACFTEDGWFRTGDAAEIDEDGSHRILGRLSTDMIKSGGYRIGAGEIEDALLAHPAVREAAVVGAPHDDLGQEIVAYVVADGVSAQQLIDHVASGLAGHKRPRRVHFLDALPRNALGKVQKKQLGAG